MPRLALTALRARTEVPPSVRTSSRSRSPRVCESRSLDETMGLGDSVSWDKYGGIDPDNGRIRELADDCIVEYMSTVGDPWRPPSQVICYAGVTRYPRRRWLGGAGLDAVSAHSRNWHSMYILGTFSLAVGKAEDVPIRHLKGQPGLVCTNIARGGGGASPSKPLLLYLCAGRRP